MEKLNSKQLLVSGLLFAILAGCNPGKIMEGNWQGKPLIPDGSDSDWGTSVQYDQDSHFFYKVSNDMQNLYVMFRVDDPLLQRKILTLGLTLWIDTTGHAKSGMGICYPKGRGKLMPLEKRGEIPRQENNDPKQFQEKFFEELQTIEFLGFNSRESDVMLIGEAKFHPVISVDKNNSLIYELVLPFTYLYGKSGIKPLKPVSIGFETGKMETSGSGEGMGRRPESGMGGGMHNGGMHGGGMRGGDMSGDGAGRMHGNLEALSETSKMWIKKYYTYKG